MIDKILNYLWEVVRDEELYTQKRNGINSTFEGADFFRNYPESQECNLSGERKG